MDASFGPSENFLYLLSLITRLTTDEDPMFLWFRSNLHCDDDLLGLYNDPCLSELSSEYLHYIRVHSLRSSWAWISADLSLEILHYWPGYSNVSYCWLNKLNTRRERQCISLSAQKLNSSLEGRQQSLAHPCPRMGREQAHALFLWETLYT